MSSRRREPRVEVSLDVKVWGVDKHGKPFVQYARTVNASSLGARLTGLDCVRVGEVIGVQLGEERSRFKVVWVGRDNTPKAGQVGLSTVEPEKALFKGQAGKIDTGWPTASPMQATETRTMANRRSPSALDAPGSSRRKQPRYNCRGGVELRHQENGAPMWASLSDISTDGCYVESTTPLPAGTEVFFQLRIKDQVIRGRAVVKTSHHAVGMGLAFRYLSPEDQQQLDFVIGSLAGGQEMQPTMKSPANTPPSTLRSAPASAVRPGPSAAAAAVPAAGGIAGPVGQISSQIMRAISELNDLEQNLVKGKVDPRLLAQFHDALEHTRQTAWTVQQWVDAHTSGGDPFAVLPQLEAERMHMFTKLAHNVTADIDSANITEYSEGITGLYESVQHLYRRLRKLLVDGAANEP